MSFFKDAFNVITVRIQEINDSISQLISTTKKVVHFFDTFFQIVPPELIFFLLFIALLMILINSVSPTTPTINLVIALVITDVFWYNFNNIFFKESFLTKIILYNLSVLLPAFSFRFVKHFFYFIKKRNLSKKLGSMDMDLFRNEITKTYHTLMGLSHEYSAGKKENIEEFKKEVMQMKWILEKLSL